MFVTSARLKWAFPTIAVILGFFWYKRRRTDRVDPGGRVDKINNDIATKSQQEQTDQRKNYNLYDSGIHIDESFTPSVNNTTALNNSPREIVCSPRRVSESLDIPMKKSSPHSLSMQSGKASSDKLLWYEDEDEDTPPNMTEIVLGSNPKSMNFDMMVRNKAAPMLLANINDDNESAVDKTTEIVEKTQSPTVSIEDCPKTIDESKTTGQQAISERDSANHSPVSGVLDGSVSDEVRSEGSTDSGKGGSINEKVSKCKNKTTYEFEIPQSYVGKLIGRGGSNIRSLNAKSDATIKVKHHPTDMEKQLCVIEGLPDNITVALDLIKRSFPTKKYPDLSFEQVNIITNPDEIPWLTELMQLQLVDGVNNDVLVCYILDPSRIFIQLPTHPTYPSLRVLDHNMTNFYNTVDTPPVPEQLSKGMLVVAKLYDKWVRAYVEEPDVTGQENIVRLVDHGGFWKFNNAEMRKIRSDYLTLPFQAIEVSLANVAPVADEWHSEAYDVVAQLVTGSIGQAQIEGYIDSSVFVSLYINMPKHGVISVAHELIARGLAKPVTLEDMIPDQCISQV